MFMAVSEVRPAAIVREVSVPARAASRLETVVSRLDPGVRIELESRLLPLPDDGAAPHGQEPGLLLDRLARLEARRAQYRDRGAMLRVPHRLIANRIDPHAPRDARELLRGAVIARI